MSKQSDLEAEIIKLKAQKPGLGGQAILDAEIKALEKKLDLINKTKTALQEETLALEEQRKLNEELKEISGDTAEIKERELKTAEEQLKLDRKILDQKIENKELTGAAAQFAEDELKVREKELDNLKGQNVLIEEKKKKNQEIWRITGLITGGLSDQLKSLFSIDGVYKSIGDQLSSILDGNAKFAQVTGQIAERRIGFGTSMSQFGLGFKELNDASMELFTSMTNFSNLNTTTQLGLAESAAKMNIFGVAVSTTGKNFDDLTKGLKMNAAEAIATNDNIAKAAIGAGIAPSKMLGEFGANMPRMAAYGKQGISVFIDLEKQAKSLGIEVSNLNAIVGENFDTFADSAKAAGQFNAVLGGNFLNSMEMLNATESERIVLLKRSFDESGKSFDALGKYEKKAIATTLGISDLNEASKLFGKSTTELTMDMAKNAASQEKMEEIQREGVKIMDSLRNVFNSFLPVIRFVAWAIKGLADGFARLNDGTKGFFGIGIGLLLIIPGLAVAFIAFGAAILTAAAGMIGFFKAFSLGANSTAAGIGKIGAAATAGAAGLLALGAASLMVGAGIGLAAMGIGQLVLAFKDLSGGAMVAAVITSIALLTAFTAIIAILGTVSAAADVPLLLLGVAIAIIGSGIAIAALGMASFVNSLVKLGNVGQGFFTAALGVGVMAASVSKLAAALAELPDNKAVMVTTVSQALTEASEIRPEEIAPATNFINTMKEYYIVQGAAKEADKDALVMALKEVMQSSKKEETSKRTDTQEKITLVVDDSSFKAYIRKTANSTSVMDTLTR